jgi:preprotein translocase subunit YajC
MAGTLPLSLTHIRMTSGISPALLAMLQAGGGSSLTPLLFQFGLIFLIFYFLIIRPQQRQRKTHEEALRTLKRGDRIVTTGGIVAEVVHIKQTDRGDKTGPSMDDEITVKSGESRLIVERGRIAKIVGVSEAAPAKVADTK